MGTAWSRILLVLGDIVEQDTDAIVNAANTRLMAGGGVDGAIHDAAGSELQRECTAIGGCAVGSARITKGYGLVAKHVIHAVGPVYRGKAQDAGRLASAYRESMRLAAKNGVRSIAFPSLSTGAFGYPVSEAAPIALETVHDELLATPAIVFARFVLFDDSTFEGYERALGRLRGTAS